MESWSNGREDLFQQLTKICDRIGNNIQAEVEDGNIVRINREELRLLRENSANVSKFAESNARLSDELEKCREAVGRVDDLEKENKRLAAELQQRLTRDVVVPQASITAGPTPKSTPLPNDPPSSVARIDCEETKPVPLEKYQRLVKKWNALADCFQDTKLARQTFEDRFRAEQDKNKEWNSFKEKMDKALVKKDEKIKRLEAEVLRLKGQTKEEVLGDPEPTIMAAPIASAPEAMVRQNVNENSSERSSIQIPASSPIRASTAPKVTDTDNEREEVHVGERPEHLTTEHAEAIELPQHRTNIRLVEETQFDPLEAHHSSSTQGEADLPPPPQEEFDGEDPDLLREPTPPETPVVVSSRSLKKRKTTHELTEATPLRAVKVEVISSSPIGLAQFLPLDESLDLDVIGGKIDTPRKHRQVQLASQKLVKAAGLSGQHQKTPANRRSTPSNKSSSKRTGSVLQPRSTNQQILPRTSEDRAPKKRRIASDKEVDTLMEDGELVTPSRRKLGGYDGDSRLIDLLSKPSPPRQALSPARSNVNLLSRPSLLRTATSGLAVEITRLPPQGLDITAEEDVHEIVKDGRLMPKDSANGQSKFFETPPRNSLTSSVEPPRPTSSISKDVSGGMQGAPKSPSKDSSTTTIPASCLLTDAAPAILSRLPPRRDINALFTAKPPVSKVSISAQKPHTKVISALKVGRDKTNMTNDEWDMDPDEEPLRVRPLETLRLQDFKINKNYNQGEDFAFREVVRGHARHSLEACTKPGCCGDKFRRLAEISTVESPTRSQEERDDELLRKFMGDNAHKLPNLSRPERHELLLQAKTRDLSYHLGRHRHAYTRQSSPPGFWRTDFPTTQEEMDDQQKAMEIERLAIVERYNEAMRPGGRYIFRDE